VLPGGNRLARAEIRPRDVHVTRAVDPDRGALVHALEHRRIVDADVRLPGEAGVERARRVDVPLVATEVRPGDDDLLLLRGDGRRPLVVVVEREVLRRHEAGEVVGEGLPQGEGLRALREHHMRHFSPLEALVVAGGLYCSLRWIVLAGQPFHRS